MRSCRANGRAYFEIVFNNQKPKTNNYFSSSYLLNKINKLLYNDNENPYNILRDGCVTGVN
ncbi:MAG: hypothetical protein Kow0090_10350 [Myxococcota bacterium]